jgi:hypothetical protein
MKIEILIAWALTTVFIWLISCVTAYNLSEPKILFASVIATLITTLAMCIVFDMENR